MQHRTGHDSMEARFAAAAPVLRLLLAVLTLSGATTTVVMAQDPAAPAPVITEVRVLQEGRPVTDPDILSLVETKAGQPFSMVDVRESRTHLDGLGRFEVEVTSEDAPGGVRVAYNLTPLRPIDRIEFRGNLRLSEGSLRAAVRERLGATMLVSRVDAAVGVLRQRYRDKGYANVQIDPRIVPRTDPDRSTLLLAIDAGAQSIVKDVQLHQDDAPGVLVGLPDVPKGKPYDAERIRQTIDKYVEAMRKNGYYEARADHSPEFQPDGVVVQVDVHRGSRVRVVFTGDELSRSEQQRLVPIRAEGTVSEDLLENSTRDIEQYLREHGYKDARAPHTRRENEGELTITFDVMRGPKYVIGDVMLTGRTALSESALRETLPLLKAGEPFVESVGDAVAEAIKYEYFDRGFVRMTIKPSYDSQAPENPADPRRVRIVYAVDEGAQVIVHSIAFAGNAQVSSEDLKMLLKDKGASEGSPLSNVKLEAGRLAVDAHYKDLGFATMRSERPTIGFSGDAADVLITLVEGTQVFVDRIIIDGNERTSRKTIENELRLSPGAPLGATNRLQSETNLRALGLFRRVRVEEKRHQNDDRVDVVVRVEEAPRTTLGYGGGLEVTSRLRAAEEGGVAEERLEYVPRGFIEIGRRGMGGKNRSVNLFTRLSATTKDTVVSQGTVNVVNSDYGINEYRVLGTFREPKVFGTPAQALFTAIAEQAIRPSYSFVTQEARAEVGGNVAAHYNASVRYSLKNTKLLYVDPNLKDQEKPLIDRLFPQVRLSKVAGTVIRNTRDNDLDPATGTFLSADAEVAPRVLGSEVGYLKTLMQLSWYRALPTQRRMVVALRGVIGAAHGFPRLAPLLDADGNPVILPDGSTELERVQDIPASERFFAGGSTTHRGFSVDRLGQRSTFTPGGFPTGGDGELLLNSEIRVSLFKAIAGVAFLDLGNIYKSASDISFADVRPAVGGGVHVRTPFGPIRVEVGVNLDRRPITLTDPDKLEQRYLLHISLGPAF